MWGGGYQTISIDTCYPRGFDGSVDNLYYPFISHVGLMGLLSHQVWVFIGAKSNSAGVYGVFILFHYN
jgi:hypothetical protein